MTRETAYQILQKHLSNPNLLKHCLAAEVTMRALAPKFNGNVDDWGITGLLHDADYDKSKGHPEKHGLLLFELEPNSIPSLIEHAIKAHNFDDTGVMPETPMDWAIYCCDQLTGLVVACALVTPNKKLADVTVEFVLKKLRQKDFAKGAKREPIYLCEEKLGIPLQEFVSLTLKAMQGIHEEIGL